MKRFKQGKLLRGLTLIIAAAILFCTQGFALNTRTAGASKEERAIKLQAEPIVVSFKLADGAQDRVTYDGNPHSLDLVAYDSVTKEPIDLKQGRDFIILYAKDINGTSEELDEGEQPRDAGSYWAYDIAGLPDGYEWDGEDMWNFTIEPLANNFTVTNLNHSYIDPAPSSFEVTVTFDTPLEKDKDYTVRYYKQNDDGTETETKPVIWDGRYRVSIQMNPNASNYKKGTQTPPGDLIMTVGKREHTLVTFYYNNGKQDPTELEITPKEYVDTSAADEPTAPENMMFMGWYRDIDGNKEYSEGDELIEHRIWVLDKDIDIVARWDASDNAALEELKVTYGGEELELCGEDYITALPFDENTDKYYLRVGVDTESVLLSLKTCMSGAQISVKNGDKSLSANDTGYEIKLDKAVNASANNISIKISAPDGNTEKEYSVYIQRMTAPKLVLNYGNSPYGMIMSSGLSDDEKAAAKADFDKTLIYDGVKPGMRYGSEAWSSSVYKNYNGDKDETAIFIYQKQSFTDPGIVAVDSLGCVVPLKSVKRTIRVTSVSEGRVDYTSAGTTVPIYIESDTNVVDNLKNMIVRPGVYEMTYSFKDTLTGETLTAVRKVIAISEVGDVFLDGKLDDKDISTIEQNLYWLNISDSLYKYRIVDVCSDANNVININDAAKIGSREAEAAAYPKYYLELK